MNEKQPYDWDKLDIEQLIASQRQEDINLDYKSSDSLEKNDGKKSEITKDVSSFANSDGGVIIYGVKEYDTTDKKHLPEKIDKGVDPSEFSREWLEQVINSGIKPKINGLRIKPIPLSSKSSIYVVYIPKSMTAHQAADKRYYKRYNFQSVSMEHYEIVDIMNRSILPNLQPSFVLKMASGLDYHYVLEVYLNNEGTTVIKNFSLELNLPKCSVQGLKGQSSIKYNWVNLTIAPYSEQAYQFQNLTFRNDRDEIIFPRQKFEFLSNDISRRYIAIETENQDMPLWFFQASKFTWVLYADNMPYKTGEIKFCDLKIQ